MSHTFFFVTPIKCFILPRPTHLLSQASIANSSMSNLSAMGRVLPDFYKTIPDTRNVGSASVSAEAELPCSKSCLGQPGFTPMAGYFLSAESCSLLHLGQNFVFEKL